MLKEVKDVCLESGVIGLIFGCFSLIWTREPLTRTDKIKKVFASIAIALIIGSVCKGFEVNYYTTVAIIGGGCSYAREIFDVISVLLKLLTEKPLNTIKQVTDIIRGGKRYDESKDN
mgnify:CR=1 FL=1